jgi:hypothetical protein
MPQADNLLTAKGGPVDIGPVNSIRPVSQVRPSPPGSEQNPDLTGVFAAELRDQQREHDSYSPGRRASSELEEEEDGEQVEEPEDDTSRTGASAHSVNFFA